MPGQRSSEELCFECRAVSGRTVKLYKNRYYSHILREHPEFERDYSYPINEIERALTQAVRGPIQGKGRAEMYYGPHLTPLTNPEPNQICVVVRPENGQTGWWVVTAYPVMVLG